MYNTENKWYKINLSLPALLPFVGKSVFVLVIPMWPWPAVLHSLPPSYPVHLYMLLSRPPLRSSSGLVRWPVPRVGFTALELEYRENKLPINEVNIQIRGHPSQNTRSEELQSHTSVISLSVGTLENLGMKGSFGESSFSVSR